MPKSKRSKSEQKVVPFPDEGLVIQMFLFSFRMLSSLDRFGYKGGHKNILYTYIKWSSLLSQNGTNFTSEILTI